MSDIGTWPINDFQRAVEDYSKAIELVGSDPEMAVGVATIYSLCGQCNEELGQTQAAIHDYENSLRLDPNGEFSDDVTEKENIESNHVG